MGGQQRGRVNLIPPQHALCARASLTLGALPPYPPLPRSTFFFHDCGSVSVAEKSIRVTCSLAPRLFRAKRSCSRRTASPRSSFGSTERNSAWSAPLQSDDKEGEGRGVEAGARMATVPAMCVHPDKTPQDEQSLESTQTDAGRRAQERARSQS